nr:BTAD domain-containing putative transcriptional regulator [Geodermatophilus sabuli]
MGGPRQRAVLAALVAAGPRMVGTEELLTDAWPAGTAPNVGTLHHYVSQLRAALEPGRASGASPEVLVRRGPGYALVVPPEAVDAVRFARLAARGADALATGRAGEAVELLSTALDLWRGPAYADVDTEGLAPVAVRLTEQRLAATEDLLDALLRTGRAADAVGRAREHTAEHPLRERGWELLALALYRSGRQADALAALGTVRRVLAEELGLDPGPGLAAVEAAVRAHDPALDPAVEPRPDPGAAPPTAPPVGTALPVPLTDLVGRDGELASVDAALEQARLVTLTGPGGVGKTRLALAVASRWAGRGHGVVLAELDALDDATLLPATVASALGIPGVPDARRLADVVGDRRVLLVLDNCEHLVDAVADLLTTLLARTAGVRVLATSRESLDVAGETVREIGPLDPAGHAVELFVQRVRAVLPDWAPDDPEQRAVRAVCAGLDGLPLAVELAAARMRVLSAEQLAEGLADRFALLGEAPRGAPRSQQGLEQTVDWSYRTLDPRERELFRRLAVFAGSFDLTAAAAVASPSAGWAATGPAPTVPLLAGLVRRSLLSVRPGPGDRRYRMLETLRAFALERSSETEREEVRTLHRRHVIRRAQAAERLVRGPDSAAALAGLRRDTPEHRTALASAIAAGDDDALLDLTAALSWHWYRSGDLVEGRRALERAAATVERPDPRSQVRRARALVGLGGLQYLAGEPGAAAAVLGAAAEHADRGGDAAVRATATAWRAHMLSFTAPAADALALAEDAVVQARAVGEGWIEAEALMILGMALRTTGSERDPRPVLAAAVDTAERAGYAWGAVSSTWALMKAAVDADDLTGALAAAARMREPLTADSDVTSWLVLVHTTAAVLARTGRVVEAATLAGAVAEHGGRIGFDPARMDPVDGPREAAAVRNGLPRNEHRRATAAGRELGREQVDALLRELLG